MTWSEDYFLSSYGGVDFDCLATSDAEPREIVEHGYPRRDGADLQDMGALARRTRCEILFWEREPLEGETTAGTARERFSKFQAAIHSGKAQDFVHPLTGTYRARVADFTYDASGDEDGISVSCTMIEDSTQPQRYAASGILDPYAGAAAARATADQVNAELAAAGISSTIGDDAADLADAWESDPTKSAREVNLELAAASAQIEALADEYELATDLANFPLYRRLQALNYSLRRAASLFRQAQPQTIQITVKIARPLRVIAAEIEGASKAEDHHAAMMRMNEIDDPSLIPAGTVLRAPAPATARGRRAA